MSENNKLKNIVEAALLAAGGPLSLEGMLELFLEEERPEKKDIRAVLKELESDYEGRGIELMEVGGGFRFNVRANYAPWVSRLWEERPARYSRALMETLALIAYRQPITRGEIEEIRGVSVSSNIMKTLLERDWVRVVGQRDVPGKPSLYATTKEFLNYFGLKSLDGLPTLQEIRDLDSINRELALEDPHIGGDSKEDGQGEARAEDDIALVEEETIDSSLDGEQAESEASDDAAESEQASFSPAELETADIELPEQGVEDDSQIEPAEVDRDV
jgi:segregation and condensation protein B